MHERKASSRHRGSLRWSWTPEISRGWLVAWALGSCACGGKGYTEFAVVDPVVDAGVPNADASTPPESPVSGIAVDTLEESILARGVLELLESHCGACHSNGMSQGGFGDVLDIQKLIEHGLVVPGSSGTSPLLALIQDGSMPPAGILERLIESEIALIARFIDELEPLTVPGCDALAFVGQDDVYATMAADISLQPAGDRPFIRYLGVTHASNAGLCGPALDRQRHALFKLVNSVSTAPDIRVPEPIDPSELVYRIDLRDYGWDREIDLEDDGVMDFSDGWLAIAASVEPYAAELEGQDADALKLETSVAVPFLPVNAFVHAATAGDLYYALIGARNNSYDTQTELGIDLDAAIVDSEVRRAGFYERSPQRETLVVRVRQGDVPDRYYWLLQDQELDDAESMFGDPLDFDGTGEQAIFNLPNGMQAYLVSARDGARLGSLPVGCVLEDCDRPERVNAASCHACHGAGLIPVTDVLRDYVEMNPVIYDRETFDAVQTQYPVATEFLQIMAQDSEIHQSAVERAGVPRGTPDPISRVFMQFEEGALDASRVAAELGVTPEALRAALGRLDPRLAPLGSPDGNIDRNTFGDIFAPTRCVLHDVARNRPAGCR
jgi:mono/diheme cytochrome c family protein